MHFIGSYLMCDHSTHINKWPQHSIIDIFLQVSMTIGDSIYIMDLHYRTIVVVRRLKYLLRIEHIIDQYCHAAHFRLGGMHGLSVAHVYGDWVPN